MLLPDISTGLLIPRSSKSVGAISPKLPVLWSSTSSLVIKNGTGAVVWAENGLPFSSKIQSAFPWSAVSTIVPPTSYTASYTLPTHSSTTSTAFTAAS